MFNLSLCHKPPPPVLSLCWGPFPSPARGWRRRHTIIIAGYLLLLLSCFLPLSADAQADTPAPIVLILDGSGSMWGKIGSDTKIGIARDVVSGLLDSLATDQPVGLVAYGHRQKGDCADIETLHKPGTDNRDAIKSSLKSLNPVGKTPLAAAALATIEDLKASGSQATLILVSDGAESCGGDLCAVITAAREAGLEFVLHVVGFDLGESDRTALECAARAGGGNYYEATDGGGLSTALRQATALTVETEPATLAVRVTHEGALKDAVVKIYEPGSDKHFTSLRTYTNPSSNPALFTLPAGEYDVSVAPLAMDMNTRWMRGVAVGPVMVDTLFFDFAPGQLSVLVTNNGELWDATVGIYPTGDTGRAAGGRTYTSPNSNPLAKKLDPGRYDVKIKATILKGEDWETVLENVEVVPGVTQVLTHDFKSGELRVGATHDGALWDCTVKVMQDGKNVTGSRTYTTPGNNPRSFLLTPGTYQITVQPLKLDAAKQTIEVTVVAGKVVERGLKF